jgi:hypothetical protein
VVFVWLYFDCACSCRSTDDGRGNVVYLFVHIRRIIFFFILFVSEGGARISDYDGCLFYSSIHSININLSKVPKSACRLSEGRSFSRFVFKDEINSKTNDDSFIHNRWAETCIALIINLLRGCVGNRKIESNEGWTPLAKLTRSGTVLDNFGVFTA